MYVTLAYKDPSTKRERHAAFEVAGKGEREAFDQASRLLTLDLINEALNVRPWVIRYESDDRARERAEVAAWEDEHRYDHDEVD